jgi:predicted cobalt transporter CbtA
MVWGIAVILLLAPHIIGAPEPDSFAGPVPPEIAALFAARALGVGLASWVLLGAFAGYFWQREGTHADASASA